jgi:hypothetical protein
LKQREKSCFAFSRANRCRLFCPGYRHRFYYRRLQNHTPKILKIALAGKKTEAAVQ